MLFLPALVFGQTPLADLALASIGTSDADSYEGINRAVAKTSISGGGPSADIVVTLRAFGDSSGPPGPYVVLDRARVRNNGPDVARDVMFEVPLPAGTLFDVIHDAGAPGNNVPQGVCQTPLQGQPGIVRCTIGDMVPGEFFAPYIRARVLPAFVDTFVTVTASAHAANPDPNPGNNTATAVALPQSASARADLAISVVVAPSPVAPSGTLVHDVTISNLGPQPTNGLYLHITYPSTLGLISFETPPGWQCAVNPIGIPLPDASSTCATEVLLGVEAVRVRIRTEIPAVQSLPVTFTFLVDGLTADPDPTNDHASITTPIGIGSGVPVPLLSPAALMLLALGIAALGFRASARRG